MPLQNRVTPFGEIIATDARGLFMGNRGGCLHDDQRRLTGRRWITHAWITCRLAFKDYSRKVMTPGRYTELFFLDEATALAAGHRPCAECRRDDFRRFKSSFADAAGVDALSAPRMDAILHAERLSASRPIVAAADLPDGAMIALDGQAWLKRGARLHAWTVAGYAARPRPVADVTGESLTPATTLKVLRNGYTPTLHSSADAIGG